MNNLFKPWDLFFEKIESLGWIKIANSTMRNGGYTNTPIYQKGNKTLYVDGNFGELQHVEIVTTTVTTEIIELYKFLENEQSSNN